MNNSHHSYQENPKRSRVELSIQFDSIKSGANAPFDAKHSTAQINQFYSEEPNFKEHFCFTFL